MSRGKGQTKSLRRVRHQERAAELRERRRLRRLRAEIHQAMEAAAEVVASKRTARAPGKKHSTKGWRVEDAESGRIIEFASSREGARRRAKEINEAPTDSDQAMLELGFERIGENHTGTPGKASFTSTPVEERYRKVTT